MTEKTTEPCPVFDVYESIREPYKTHPMFETSKSGKLAKLTRKDMKLILTKMEALFNLHCFAPNDRKVKRGRKLRDREFIKRDFIPGLERDEMVHTNIQPCPRNDDGKCEKRGGSDCPLSEGKPLDFWLLSNGKKDKGKMRQQILLIVNKRLF
jgi:hypothetical protein